jgi:hypothetical protein
VCPRGGLQNYNHESSSSRIINRERETIKTGAQKITEEIKSLTSNMRMFVKGIASSY